MTFEQKLKAMTAKEIIMAMVTGLRKRHISVDMRHYGIFIDDVCYGCAAANCIIEIDGTKDHLFPKGSKTRKLFEEIIGSFESAIDCLRCGDLYFYNIQAKRNSFALIENPNDIELPILDNDYTEEQLLIYEQLANDQI